MDPRSASATLCGIFEAIPGSIISAACNTAQALQSGASSLAKQGGAYFSAVCGSIQDPIAAPGPYENQEP